MARRLLQIVSSCGTLMVSLTLLTGVADAQAGLGGSNGAILNDPFTFYYAFYLPNQQMQSMRIRPSDTINQAMVQRQYFAQQSDRRTLYDPVSPYSQDAYDPLRPYSQQGQERARGHLSSLITRRTPTVPVLLSTTAVLPSTFPSSELVLGLTPMSTRRAGVAARDAAAAAVVAWEEWAEWAACREWVVAWVAWVAWG